MELCRKTVNTVLPSEFNPGIVLDPGAGSGVWGKAIKERYTNTSLVGVELQHLTMPEGYALWLSGYDFLDQTIDYGNFDLVIGNPPYSLAEEFLERSYNMLNPGGWLVFLLRLSFLESHKRFSKYYQDYTSMKPFSIWVSTRRVSFTGNRKSDNTAYMVGAWRKDWGVYNTNTYLKWLDWSYDSP